MSIQITEQASQKIKEGLKAEGLLQGGLRLGVRGGGCLRFELCIEVRTGEKGGDKVFEQYGVKVFVDMKSYLYLKGMGLDWRGSLMQEGFTFVNPNASKTCSCGQSFTV